MCKEDVRHMIQARGSEEDQALIRELRQKLGLTKNSTVLTALRIGLDIMKDEVAPVGLSGGG